MSVLAGFDLVAEISNPTITKLLEQLGRLPLEFHPDIESDFLNGYAHIIVHDFELDLNGDDTVTLTLLFANTSIVLTDVIALTITALDGSLAVTAPILVVDTDQSNEKEIGADLASATVTIAFSPSAQDKIEDGLTGVGISPMLFQTLLTEFVGDTLRSFGLQTAPIQFVVEPGNDGELWPSQRFESLEVHCIEHADRARQALGLFATLLAANHGEGNHALKTSTAIPTGRGLCASLSPEAFQALVFCPAVADNLGHDVADLPHDCGEADDGLNVGGATLTALTMGFDAGHLDFSAGAKKSASGCTATGLIQGSISLAINSGEVAAEASVDHVDLDIGGPSWCDALGEVITELFNNYITDLVETVIEDQLNAVISDVTSDIATSFTIDGDVTVSVEELTVSPEALTACGDLALPPFVPSSPKVVLVRFVEILETQELDTGTFHSTACPVGDFPYTELAQRQRVRFTASTSLVGHPQTYEWHLRLWQNSSGTPVLGPAVPLPSETGTTAYPDVRTYYPFPLPIGTAVGQEVHVESTRIGNAIELTNAPEEGNFSGTVSVTVTDPVGTVVVGEGALDFDGSIVVMGGDYYEQLAGCGIVIDLAPEILDPERAPEPAVVLGTEEESARVMIDFLRGVLSSGSPEADETIARTRMLHGRAFRRALMEWRTTPRT